MDGIITWAGHCEILNMCNRYADITLDSMIRTDLPAETMCLRIEGERLFAQASRGLGMPNWADGPDNTRA